jgi:predicted DNA-binding transcriptional regulator YafY
VEVAPANILQILSRAIKERRCIAIRYQGQRSVRVVEPHAIYSDEQSQLVLDAYQIRGHSSSGRPLPFWRPFRVKKIDEVEILKNVFMPRTAEGFSAARLKYKNGLVAIAEAPGAVFAQPDAVMEVGPPRPSHMRRAV